MKKWMMPIGLIVVICILTASVAMPICLAAHDRIEIEGKLNVDENKNPLNVDEYKIGELYKGDKIKVVMSRMRGDGNIKVLLANTPRAGQETYLNFLHAYLVAIGMNGPVECLPCLCYSLICPKPTIPAIEETTITYEGEEKTFTVPKDGVYYLNMEAEKGNVIYKGYIEVIKTEK